MFFTLEYDVIYAEFKNLKLYNFVKSDQNDTKFCTRPFLHNIRKSISLGGRRGRVKVLRDTILLQSFYTDSKSTRTWILVNISKLLYVNSLSLGPSGISEIATHSLVLAVLHCTSVCGSLPCAWIFRYFCWSSQQTQPLKIWIWLRLNYF